MGRIRQTDKAPEGNPEDLVQSFAAAGNFPKERAGVLALAQALFRSAKDFGLSMQAIVQACCDCSQWCPTPYELRNVGLSMRDAMRAKKEKSQHAEWERIYGPPDPDWSAKLLGLYAESAHGEQRTAMHDRAIRDMLFYTEGDGCDFGDREYWDGTSGGSYSGRAFDLDHYPELVAEIRARGGWSTERELAVAENRKRKEGQ